MIGRSDLKVTVKLFLSKNKKVKQPTYLPNSFSCDSSVFQKLKTSFEAVSLWIVWRRSAQCNGISRHGRADCMNTLQQKVTPNVPAELLAPLILIRTGPESGYPDWLIVVLLSLSRQFMGEHFQLYRNYGFPYLCTSLFIDHTVSQQYTVSAIDNVIN
jgi:hypothetical protein